MNSIYSNSKYHIQDHTAAGVHSSFFVMLCIQVKANTDNSYITKYVSYLHSVSYCKIGCALLMQSKHVCACAPRQHAAVLRPGPHPLCGLTGHSYVVVFFPLNMYKSPKRMSPARSLS